MKRTHKTGAVACAFLAVIAVSVYADTASRAADEAAIWKMEQAIYAQRSEGKMSLYLDLADPDYVGWPPQVAAPMTYKQLKAQEARGADNAGERIELQKQRIQIHRDGHIALAYYSSHRTRRGGGREVDERWETIHVWVHMPSGWKLMGGMARPVPDDRASLGVTPLAPAGK